MAIQPSVDGSGKVAGIISDWGSLQRRFKTGKFFSCRWAINKQSYETAIHNSINTNNISFHDCDFHLEVESPGNMGCASFNRSLILATWFIHVATADITTLINHAVRHAGRPRAQTGLTNLNTIFHLNNLALPQGRPTPDTAHWREALLVLLFLSVWAQRLSTAC